MGWEVALVNMFEILQKLIKWAFVDAEFFTGLGGDDPISLGGIMVSITVFGILIRSIMSIPKGQGKLSVSNLRRNQDE